MSKKRRTKKEKLIAQLRKKTLAITSDRQNSPSEPNNNSQATYTISDVRKKEVGKPAESTSNKQNKYDYVLKDARQTILITTSIITLNLALYFLIQYKMLSLSVFGL